MPFTPFHFGPGALLHAVAPRQVSFVAFCAANVLIDRLPAAWRPVGARAGNGLKQSGAPRVPKIIDTATAPPFLDEGGQDGV